jgi:hypothetical protein
MEGNYIFIQDSTIRSSITNLFTKTESPILDEFIIQINQVNKDKVKELKCEGHGSWLGQIYIDGKKYWSQEEEYDEWTQTGFDVLLPSDSLKRGDLQALLTNDYDNAQKYKEDLENLQRSDKKLRQHK